MKMRDRPYTMTRGSIPQLVEVPVTRGIMSSRRGILVYGYTGYCTKGTPRAEAATSGVMTYSSPLIQLLTY